MIVGQWALAVIVLVGWAAQEETVPTNLTGTLVCTHDMLSQHMRFAVQKKVSTEVGRVLGKTCRALMCLPPSSKHCETACAILGPGTLQAFSFVPESIADAGEASFTPQAVVQIFINITKVNLQHYVLTEFAHFVCPSCVDWLNSPCGSGTSDVIAVIKT